MQVHSNGAMIKQVLLGLLSITLLVLISCNKDNNDQTPDLGSLEIVYIYIGDANVYSTSESIVDELDKPIKIKFSKPVDPTLAEQAISLVKESVEVDVSMGFNQTNELLTITPGALSEATNYTLTITGELKGATGESFEGLQI
ncbi:MAG: Ig-like domain-containing protein, partial [Cyclobacteriaceae bacterium]